jgi:hypothetical protein
VAEIKSTLELMTEKPRILMVEKFQKKAWRLSLICIKNSFVVISARVVLLLLKFLSLLQPLVKLFCPFKQEITKIVS